MATVLEPRTKQSALETTTPDPECPSERGTYRLTAAQALKVAEAGVFEGQGRVELWDGVFYTTTKGELHNTIVTEVAEALRALIPKDYRIREEKSCSADPASLPEPDVVVYKAGKWDYVRAKTPPPLSGMLLVVEVNCSTPEDYTERLAKYAQAGVPTYWVVDGGSRSVSVFTKPRLDGAARYGESKTFNRGEEIEVILGAETFGKVRVSDFFMPEAAG
jgi:Uma2 family endonuclease